MAKRVKIKWVGQVEVNVDLYAVPDDLDIQGLCCLERIIQDRAADAVKEYFRTTSKHGLFASTTAQTIKADIHCIEPEK